MKNKLLLTGFLLTAGSFSIYADDPCISSQAPGYCSSRIVDSSVNEARETTDRAMALPNRLSENDFNAINNPSHLMNHGTAYLEGWTAQQYAWGGATIPLPIDNMKLGVFIRRPVSDRHPIFNTFINPALIGTAAAVSDDTARIKYNTNAVPYMTQLGMLNTGAPARGLGNVDAFLGMSLGQSLNIGLRVGYMSASKKDTDNTATGTTFQRNESAIQEPSVGLGVQIKNLGPGYLDVAGSFSLPSAKWDAATATNTYSAKNKFAYMANVLVRYVTPIGQNKLIVAAVADFYNIPMEMTDSNAAGSQKRISTANYTSFSIDAAFWQTITDTKLKVIYSTGFGYLTQGYALKTDAVSGTGGPDTLTTSVDSQYRATHAYIPLGVAIEHQTLETLKTRFGVRKNVFAPKTTETTAGGTVTKESSSQFAVDEELMVALGLGWTPAAKVNIDLAMNANAFKLDSFFTAISARYHY
ncbi:MAG: hypothetical protein U1F16_18005 [Turneriella sp.]